MTQYDITNISGTQPRENIITMGMLCWMNVLDTEENYQYAFISFSFRCTHSDIFLIMNEAVNNIWTLAYWKPSIIVSLLYGLTLSWKHTFTMWPFYHMPWWCHQMKTFSALLAPCPGNSTVNGEFPALRPVTRRFDVFFDLRLYKRLSEQS